MAKYYKKSQRKKAMNFLIENPTVIEKIRCIINEPSLSNKKIKKLFKKILKACIDDKDNIAVGGYGANDTMVVSLDGYGDYDEDVDISKLDRKAQKYLVDKFLSSLH